ncbi:MAG: hypothetical protein H7321_09465 [Bacteroidia bacterium]|nr:hypothetical protein [Bacteroidia bacterium]
MKKINIYPEYILRFSISILFFVLAGYIYFTGVVEEQVRNIFCGVLVLYGIIRLVRTYQQLNERLREEKNNENEQ